MRVLTNEYRLHVEGVTERNFALERIAQGELRAQLQQLAEAFVAGDVKADSVVRTCDYNPERHTVVDHNVIGREGKTKKYEHLPRPLELRDVLAVKFHERGGDHLEYTLDGEKAEPFARITLADTSQLDFAWPKNEDEAPSAPPEE